MTYRVGLRVHPVVVFGHRHTDVKRAIKSALTRFYDCLMTEPIGRLTALVLDCPDPVELAEFYRAIVGGETIVSESGQWVELRTNDRIVAFQRVASHRRPTWPDGEVPQQAHLDIVVDDLDIAAAALADLHVDAAPVQPSPDEFRVFFDPAGHPFCVVDANA